MRFIDTQQHVFNSDWPLYVEIEEGFKPSARDIVPLAFALTLEHWPAPLGVIIDSPDQLGVLANYLENIALIAVPFPVYRDGRGFSIAKRLRSEYHYEGKLWAIGDLLPDQYAMLLECGFDAVELTVKHSDAKVWQAAYKSIALRYQQDAQEQSSFDSVLKARHG